MQKVRVEHIDIEAFLEEIVRNHLHVEDPEAFLEWAGTVAILILQQIQFPCITETVQ